MSLLTIARAIATNCSVSVPSAVLSSQTDDNLKIVRFTTEAADEVARRVDWAALRQTTTLTGTGANENFALPSGFSRLISGMAISVAGSPVRVGLTPDEWASLTPTQGTPRYARLSANTLSFYPYPPDAMEISVTFQSKNWLTSGAEWGDDADEALVPEILIQQGAIWRWRRQLGQDFQDYLAEFEATLADLAKFDGGIRTP